MEAGLAILFGAVFVLILWLVNRRKIKGKK